MRETLGVFLALMEIFLAQIDIHIQVWYMVEIMRRGLNGYHQMQVAINENQRGTMQMMRQVVEQVRLD